MYTYLVGMSRNGRQVYTNIINSAAGRYFSRQPHLIRIAQIVVESLDLTEKEIRLTQDIGRTIGNTNIVTTGEKDAIFYAHQLKQAYASRFVKNRSMEPSSELSIVLAADSEGNYELANVWIGPACPPFPGTPGARRDSKSYWKAHALIAGSEPIDSQSMTSACPF